MGKECKSNTKLVKMKPTFAEYCLVTRRRLDVYNTVCLTVSYSLGWNWKSCALWNTGFSCMNNC